MTDAGWVKAGPGGDGQAWQFGGAWTLGHANTLDQATAALKPGAGTLTFDLSPLEMLDTVGAWLILLAAYIVAIAVFVGHVHDLPDMIGPSANGVSA